MKKLACILLFALLISYHFRAQPKFYFTSCEKADSLYQAGEYLQSAYIYQLAFEYFRGKAHENDRYNAARSWASGNEPDSALRHLEQLVYKSRYAAYYRLDAEAAFAGLHTNFRWKNLMDTVKAIVAYHKIKNAGVKDLFEPALAAHLDSIHTADQFYRRQHDALESRYGVNSKEVKELDIKTHYNDSMNRIKVRRILDTRGWLGPEVVHGGSAALFLVVQHSDLDMQLQYLPMMREAAKKGKLLARDLAMLEDRVLVRQNKKQIYGTQMKRDSLTGKFHLGDLIEPDTVDERRAAVGLGPLSDYMSHWDLVWDLEVYKKEEAERENKIKLNSVSKPSQN